jgi:hypothetical protein
LIDLAQIKLIAPERHNLKAGRRREALQLCRELSVAAKDEDTVGHEKRVGVWIEANKSDRVEVERYWRSKERT